MGVASQLLDEPLLETSQTGLLLLFLLQRWRREDLDVGHKQVLPEGQAKDVQVLPTVAEGAGQRDEH